MKSTVQATKIARYTLLCCFAVVLIVGGCHSNGIDGVRVTRVKTAAFTKTVSATGTVEPCNPQYVYPATSGPIATVDVAEGDRVEPGQVLATMDKGALDTEAKKAESNYLTQASMGELFSSLFADLNSMFGAFNSSLELTDYYRKTVDAVMADYNDRMKAIAGQFPDEMKKLVDDTLVNARTEYDRLVSGTPSLPRVSSTGYPSLAAAADDSRAELAYEQYQKALAGAQNSDLKAPVAGYVFFSHIGGLIPDDLLSSIKSDVGGFTSSLKFLGGGMEKMLEGTVLKLALPELELKPGSTLSQDKPAFTICDLSRVNVRLKVEEADIALVKVGQEVDVTAEAIKGYSLKGIVRHVAMSAAISLSETPEYEVVVEVDASGCPEPVRLGYTANAEIKVLDRKKTVLVPLSAVLMEPHPHVFVVSRGTAHAREVKLGMEDEERVEILEGLTEHERIVIKGAGKVKEGSGL